MIRTYGKFNDVNARCALDLKILSVLKKSNPLDVVYKDITKFDMLNLIIGSLLTQIESAKLTDKTLDEFLSKFPFLKDFEIAEKLKKLRDFKKKNKDDDDDDNNTSFGRCPLDNFDRPLPPPYYPPSPTSKSDISDDDNDIGNILTETQKFWLGNKVKKMQ